jgi:hypothetical protein
VPRFFRLDDLDWGQTSNGMIGMQNAICFMHRRMLKETRMKRTVADLRIAAMRLRHEIVEMLNYKKFHNAHETDDIPLDIGLEVVAIKLCDDHLKELDCMEREGGPHNNRAMRKLIRLYQTVCDDELGAS